MSGKGREPERWGSSSKVGVRRGGAGNPHSLGAPTGPFPRGLSLGPFAINKSKHTPIYKYPPTRPLRSRPAPHHLALFIFYVRVKGSILQIKWKLCLRSVMNFLLTQSVNNSFIRKSQVHLPTRCEKGSFTNNIKNPLPYLGIIKWKIWRMNHC